MLKSYLALLFIIFPLWLSAQYERPIHHYLFAVECPIYRCDINGELLDSSYIIAPINAKFILVEKNKLHCIIRFKIFKKHEKKRMYNFEDADYSSYRYFRISKAQFDFKCAPIFTADYSISIGNIILPLKFRRKPFGFTKDFTIGPTFGLKYNFKTREHTAVNLLFATGLTDVTLDSSNTGGRVAQIDEALAFSPAIGCLFEFGNAQIGLFMGKDYFSNINSKKYNWIYEGKLWFSFGFGYAIYSKEWL